MNQKHTLSYIDFTPYLIFCINLHLRGVEMKGSKYTCIQEPFQEVMVIWFILEMSIAPKLDFWSIRMYNVVPKKYGGEIKKFVSYTWVVYNAHAQEDMAYWRYVKAGGRAWFAAVRISADWSLGPVVMLESIRKHYFLILNK